MENARNLMAPPGDCLNRKHYKCGCTKHASVEREKVGEELVVNERISNFNPAELMRYMNKIGIEDGMIFPEWIWSGSERGLLWD